jgi:hypothetical protein
MVLEEKKQALSQEEMPEKPEKIHLPSKEEEKNASVFDKNGTLPLGTAREELRKHKDKLFREYGITGKDVEKLAKEVTSDKIANSLFDEKDIEKFEKYKKEEIKGIKNPKENREAKQKSEKELKALKDVFPGEKEI